MHPQQLVAVAPGRHLNLVCIGEGSPTILFESGMGEPTSTWALVQSVIGRERKACSYDRKGIGFSDGGDGDGSAASAVADLEVLLAAALIEPPYVLVGQSYGAMIARLYYYRHPENVSGMVLVDPSIEEQSEGMRMVSPRAFNQEDWKALGDATNQLRERCILAAQPRIEPGHPEVDSCVVAPPEGTPPDLVAGYLDMQRYARFQRAQQAEELAFDSTSVEQLRGARRSFGSLPLVVLSRSRDTSAIRTWETPRLRAARENIWFGLHRWLSDASSAGEHRVIEDSTHALHLSNPESVVAAIRDVVVASSAVSATRAKSLHEGP